MAHYYLDQNNQSVGPMDLAAIRRLAEKGIVKPDVLIREAGSETWRPLSRRKEPAIQAETPKPPRTPPPAQRPQQTAQTAQASQPNRVGSVPSRPDWFPLASIIAGIVALLCLGLPPLAILLGGTSLTMGLLGYRSPDPKGRPLSIAGISTSSVALVVSLGIILMGAAGIIGNPETRYVGSWQSDMSMQIVSVRVDHSIVVTFHENGRFTEITGEQFNGANYDTGQAMRMAGGGKTTGYWKWDPARKAVVTRYDGRNHTGYFEGATNDGRSLSVAPFDAGPSSVKAQEEFWVFKPDPDNRNVLIGVHPTTYHHRTMKFYRLD